MSRFAVNRGLVIKLVDVAMFLLWATAIFIVLVTSVPEHAVGTTHLTKDLMKAILPEGWAFFTRNPREATDRFFDERPDGSLIPANAADIRIIGSANRAERIRSIELSMIISQIPREAWIPCQNLVSDCLKLLPKQPVPISVRMHECSYSGRGIVQRRTPVPWAWRSSYNRVRTPSLLARLEVTCVSIEGTP